MDSKQTLGILGTTACFFTERRLIVKGKKIKNKNKRRLIIHVLIEF